MKIKLLFPLAISTYYQAIDLPYGLSVLTSFLRKNNISVDLDDLNARLKSPYSPFRSRRIHWEILKFYQSQIYAGYYTGISDKRNDLLADTFLNLIDLGDYDIVGIGVISGNQILTALLLTEKIKKEYNIPVVLGGTICDCICGSFL